MKTEPRTGRDTLRQALNVVGAVGQIALGFTADVGRVSDEFRSPIVPAGYAFAIWGVIFLLLAAYAVYQALPGRATDYLPRAIGWWTAAAMLGNTVWMVLFPNRAFVPAQIVIFLIAFCAIRALTTYAEVLAVRRPTSFERWIVGPGVGLLAGWITAAAFVGLAGTLIARGWENEGTGAFVGGAGLLLFAGGVAAWALARASVGPATAWLPYGAAVIWALAGVVVNQLDRSTLVAAVSVAIAAIVVVLLAAIAREHRRGSAAMPLRA